MDVVDWEKSVESLPWSSFHPLSYLILPLFLEHRQPQTRDFLVASQLRTFCSSTCPARVQHLWPFSPCCPEHAKHTISIFLSLRYLNTSNHREQFFPKENVPKPQHLCPGAPRSVHVSQAYKEAGTSNRRRALALSNPRNLPTHPRPRLVSHPPRRGAHRPVARKAGTGDLLPHPAPVHPRLRDGTPLQMVPRGASRRRDRIVIPANPHGTDTVGEYTCGTGSAAQIIIAAAEDGADALFPAGRWGGVGGWVG